MAELHQTVSQLIHPWLVMGREQMEEFESSWPEGLYRTISKKVVVMSTLKLNYGVLGLFCAHCLG